MDGVCGGVMQPGWLRFRGDGQQRAPLSAMSKHVERRRAASGGDAHSMTENAALPGLMQHHGLTVDRFLDFAAQWHGDVPVNGRDTRGGREETTYRQLHRRARQLSAALRATGIRSGDRVATLAMNHLRHVEAWYAIMGVGAVCHTVNPRLFDEQIAYIINHAADRILMVDAAFLPTVGRILSGCPSIETVIVFPDGSADGLPADRPAACIDYEAFLQAGAGLSVAWGEVDETAACGLCYTSGTTGAPKGVLYSHRSNYLHTLASLQHDFMNLSATDSVLPIVPMFHANAWGLVFSAPAVGAKLVLPGARLDGASLHRLIEEEEVTFSAGVPTVWQGLLQHLAASGGRLSTLKRVLVGGAACPEALVRAFQDDHGIEVLHAWGMTETSPVAAAAAPTWFTRRLPVDQQRRQALKQGRPMFGVDLALKGDAGDPLPHDGETPGYLMVRGATVAEHYFGDDREILDANGWFDTGDVATIDPHGFMRITDRSKDLIKSGGEWISSIEIENHAVSHPKVAMAAVVGVEDERWGERPLLVVQLVEGENSSAEELLGHLEGRIARWWMPDAVMFVARVPLGPTGKIDKKRIRAELVGDAA